MGTIQLLGSGERAGLILSEDGRERFSIFSSLAGVGVFDLALLCGTERPATATAPIPEVQSGADCALPARQIDLSARGGEGEPALIRNTEVVHHAPQTR